MTEKDILYEDNHLIIVNKKCGEIVQGDKTGDKTLADEVKEYLKVKYNKPGNVFLGITHRLDRPTSGAVIFAKTGKALSRINELFKQKRIDKRYLAVVDKLPPKEKDDLTHYIFRNQKQNKSYAYDEQKFDAKEASLTYSLIAESDKYFLLEIDLNTGRHHQIRAQLVRIGCRIKGDMKYGYPRSNPDAGIHLHAYKISFNHPVSREVKTVVAPPPEKDKLWNYFWDILKNDPKTFKINDRKWFLHENDNSVRIIN